MTLNDQLNRPLFFKEIPKRIVSLVPSQTELLVDLGLEDMIVGVTKFCVHPKHLRKSKSIVGGTKQVNLQKIIALQPDIILCNKEENTESIVNSLLNIAPVHVSDITQLSDCFELIHMYGKLFNVESSATKIISTIQKERIHFQNKIAQQNKATIAYFIWKNPWMVAASNTFINEMIEEAGFINVYKDAARYPEIDLKDNRFNKVDRIFLSSELTY